ncbi:MAG: hypothetical protein CVV47_04180 [Spirochaetae bacterium HGW-Spirochaetae-3]|jgi:hypothetical protein|nr:MAG: hypothetical protein CVV47_04180 [Spirochaetae bacterium HGW-Spirochaetae-3]
MRTFYILLFLFAAAPAFSYLDPGTGSLLLYALSGIATSMLFGLRNVWYWLRGKSLFRGGPAVSSRLPDVVFHSEGGKYWQVFEPVIEALTAEGVACAYVTPDAKDPGLSSSIKGLNSLRPGGEMATISFMNAASAALVVSTTPHLDVYMLRRSKGVKRYAHLFHSPTDIVFYEKYAFDWYDALMTVGPFQEQSVRALESCRGTPRKELLPTGNTYFDYMLEETTRLPTRSDGKKIALYAPTWGIRSSVLKYGAGILESLAEAGFQVIFRPHPQFYVSHKELIEDIEKLSGRLGSRIEIDRKRTGIESMARSDLMVTDLSGVLFDYACLFGKPVLLAMADAEPGGQEGEDLAKPYWDVEASHELSFGLVGDDLEGLPALAESAMASTESNADRIRDFRDRNFYNFGHAGKAAADNIVEIIRGSY